MDIASWVVLSLICVVLGYVLYKKKGLHALSNRMTYDIAGFTPTNHEDDLVVRRGNDGILIHGTYEKVMQHASFLIHENRTLIAKSYKNAGLAIEIYLVSQ